MRSQQQWQWDKGGWSQFQTKRDVTSPGFCREENTIIVFARSYHSALEG